MYCLSARASLSRVILLLALFLLAGCGINTATGGNGTSLPETGAAGVDGGRRSSGDPLKEPLEPLPMKVGYAATAMMYAPQFVAGELGIYEKHGLDAELHFVSSTSEAIPAVQSGRVDIVSASGAAVIDAVAEGESDLVILGDALHGAVLEVWVQPEINSIADIVGKTVGSTSAGSVSDRMTERWLEEAGYKKSDVQMAYLGDLNSLVEGMRSRQIDAALLPPPFGGRLQPTGQKLLADLRDQPFSNHALIAKRSYVENHPEAVERYMRALTEAIAVIKQQKDRVLPVLPKYTGIEDPEWNEYAYRFHVDMFQAVPRADIEVLRVMQDLSSNEKARSVNLRDYVDNSFVDKLEQEGYIDALYQ